MCPFTSRLALWLLPPRTGDWHGLTDGWHPQRTSASYLQHTRTFKPGTQCGDRHQWSSLLLLLLLYRATTKPSLSTRTYGRPSLARSGLLSRLGAIHFV